MKITWVRSLPFAAVLLLQTGCGESVTPVAAAAVRSVQHESTPQQAVDRTLPAWQQQLLQDAFRAASMLPLDPHVKNRARIQAAVVATCLELGQPQQAAKWIEQMSTWRQGYAYADLGYYCAGHGDTAAAQRYLAVALKCADLVVKDPDAQDWPRDRIRARIAAGRYLLGEGDAARQLTVGLAATELGAVETERVRHMDLAAYTDELKVLQGVLDKGEFDPVRGALDTCARLFDRFFADAQKREQLQQMVETGYPKLPVQARLELLMQLCQSALRHQDKPLGLAVVDRAEKLLGDNRFLPEDQIPLAANLAALRGECGDRDGAGQRVNAAFAAYREAEPRIVDIYRAGVLRALAAAWQQLGDREAGLMACKLALAAGVQNPNSRPRAEDFAATCCSMAVHGIEPDAATLAQIGVILGGLGDPW